MKTFKIKSAAGRDTVIVHGTPDPNLIPPEIVDYLLHSLELEICEYYREKNQSDKDKPPP